MINGLAIELTLTYILCLWKIHTLRYYEKIGLIVAIGRNSNGYRYYSAADIEWISFLKRLKATGMAPELHSPIYSERPAFGGLFFMNDLLYGHEFFNSFYRH